MRLEQDEKRRLVLFVHDAKLALRDLPSLAKGTKHRQWIPVLPEGTLAALPTGSGERAPFEVTRDTLDAAVSELRRYYADLAAAGLEFRRPIIAEHNIEDYQLDADGLNARVAKNGRRSGDILDAEVRLFDSGTLTSDGPNARDTLFLLADWNANAWQAIQDDELEHISIHIVPEYVDPQTGNEYGPFILELSETVIPVVKDFNLKQTLDPTVPERLGLRLADTPEEHPMNEEQVAALIAAALAPFAEKLEALSSELASLKAAEDDEPEEELNDDAPLSDAPGAVVDPAPAAPAPTPAEPAVSLADVQKQLVKLSEANAALERRIASGTARLSEPGAPGAKPTGAAPVVKLSEADALAKAETELGPKAHHLAIIKRAEQLRGE